MDTFSLLSIIGTVVGTGLAIVASLGTMAWRMTSRLDRRIDLDRAESEANRRAFHEEMRTFEREMRRIAERQSHTEARLDTPA